MSHRVDKKDQEKIAKIVKAFMEINEINGEVDLEFPIYDPGEPPLEGTQCCVLVIGAKWVVRCPC